MDETNSSPNLGMLHLPLRLHNSLVKSGIITVGDFLNIDQGGLAKLNRIGQSSISQILKHQAILSSVGEAKGKIYWFDYWRLLDIAIISSDLDESSSIDKIVEEIPSLVQEVFHQESDDRLGVIIFRRFGLKNHEVLTLDDLGVALRVTRERVRQLEKKAINILRDVFLESSYPGKSYHIHPGVTSSLQYLLDCIERVAEFAILESELLGILASSFELDTIKDFPTLKMLLALFGLHEVRFINNNLESIWGFFDSTEQRLSATIVNRVDRLLTVEIASPISLLDLLIHINRGLKPSRRVTQDKLRQILDLCSSIEQYEDDIYQSRFEHLAGRENQVERILLAKGEPLHIREITREINHRLLIHGKKLVNSRNLVNQISQDRRFSPIGKSGVWSLSSWAVDTSTIVELMKECLITRNQALTSDEIFAYVRSRRPVKRSSIDSYLLFKPDFVRVDRKHWVLASWPEAERAKTWNPEEVGEFVEGLFSEEKVKEIEYKKVKESLIQAAKVRDRQTQCMLNVNPVISTIVDPQSGIRIARLNPNYKDDLASRGAKIQRKNKTLRRQVEEAVKEILIESPGHQISLNELVSILVKRFNRRDKTFYRYISDMTFLEKQKLPETGKIVCRLRREGVQFSEVELIKSSKVKKSVTRALSFLNERDVDIALFLLSKEFESILKSYLVLASRKGKIKLNLKGHITLDQMISIVRKERIITDQAVLHFLRQKRNDRSHGPMPSLEERRLMMKHAPTTAGMYVDYIKHFDDLGNDL